MCDCICKIKLRKWCTNCIHNEKKKIIFKETHTKANKIKKTPKELKRLTRYTKKTLFQAVASSSVK